MNTSQKRYTAQRIQQIAQSQQVRRECDKPSLAAHLRRAAASGELVLLPSAQIKEAMTTQVIEGNSFRDTELNASDIFAPPKSYKEAVKQREAEEKAIERTNRKITEYAKHLEDRLHLDEFDDGKEAIALMLAFDPATPSRS